MNTPKHIAREFLEENVGTFPKTQLELQGIITAALTKQRQEFNVVIVDMAEQLEAWVRETRKGGWSTHQVEPMQRKADGLRRHILLT